MTDIGVVLSLFSALAVLAVGAILGAAAWARARAGAREQLAGEAPAGDAWLAFGSDDDAQPV